MKVVLNQFDMPLARDPLGLSAAELARDPRAEGSGPSGLASAYGARKSVLQTQVGAVVTQQIDSEQSLTARSYYGTRENLQYQALRTPTNAGWVGLEREYLGFGLLYNLRTEVSKTPVIWAAGYDFDQSRENRQGGFAKNGEKSDTNRDELNSARNSDFFFQANALLSERVSAVIGARRSSVHFTSDDRYLLDGDASGARSFSATNPVFGLTFHAMPALNLYANYGRGFETPTLAEVAYTYNQSGTTPIAKFNPLLNASSSQHREVGAKWLPAPGSRLDLAAYQIDTRDEIVVRQSAFGNNAFDKADGTRRTGLEAAASTLLNSNTRFSLSANVIDATFSRDYSYRTTNAAGTADRTVNAGFKLPGIPKNFIFSELLWSSIRLDSSRPPTRPGSFSPGSGTRLGLELIHAGKIYADEVNSEADSSAPGYTLLSAVASQGWSIGRAQLTAYARIENLTDKNYVGSVIVNQSSKKYFEPGAARNWIAGLRFNLPL
jgi:iron complex outermembrane receptor protein